MCIEIELPRTIVTYDGLFQNKTAADDIPSLSRSPSKVSSQKQSEGGEEESKGNGDKMEED